jgi:hypothetical protein
VLRQIPCCSVVLCIRKDTDKVHASEKITRKEKE